MIEVFNICDELVTRITAFQETVNGRQVVAERGYHFVDGKQVPPNQVAVVVYPMARQKERNGTASKKITATVYVVIKASVLPSQRDILDEFVRYGTDLDEHLEGQTVCGATYVMTDDDQFYWFPDELHKRNHFNSLIELQYRWTDAVGGNPET